MNDWILLLSLILLPACSLLQPVQDRTTHHLLTATITTPNPSASSPAIAVATPSLPGYLDRLEIVRESSPQGLRLHSDHLWAEPLATGIARVTALNLSHLANSLHIRPAADFIGLDYDSLLEIHISRFEPDPNGHVILDCSWKLQPLHGPTQDFHPFLTSIPPAPPTAIPDPPIPAMNEALAQLARHIHLRSLKTGSTR